MRISSILTLFVISSCVINAMAMSNDAKRNLRVLEVTNAYRASVGAAPLRNHATLASLASTHASYLL